MLSCNSCYQTYKSVSDNNNNNSKHTATIEQKSYNRTRRISFSTQALAQRNISTLVRALLRSINQSKMVRVAELTESMNFWFAVNFSIFRDLSYFYPRDAMLARVFATATCLSVRPSVCLSHAGIVPSTAKAGSWNVHRLIAPWF